jgi:hypothetical protein
VSFPFDKQSAAMFDSHMPCHDHAVLKVTSQGYSKAWQGHGMCELASAVQRQHVGNLCLAAKGYHAEFHEGYQKHTNPLNCRTSSSDISGYHADFHEGHGTVREWQGHDMARV